MIENQSFSELKGISQGIQRTIDSPPEWLPCLHDGGHLVVVGGAEDRIRKKDILRRFTELSGGIGSRILVVAIASETPEVIFDVYKRAFSHLGVTDVRGLLCTTRDELQQLDPFEMLDGVTGIYFSGGDQLRISSILGGTRFQNLMEHMIRSGVTFGGTSAGASAMSDAMIIGWDPSEQPLAGNVRMCSGLGVLRHMVIDQHFTERNRLNRLITAVAHHPGYLGVGVDEDTAAIISADGSLNVLGAGTVTIVDGTGIKDCNIAAAAPHHPFSVTGLKVHVLSIENQFNLNNREVM
ncbi:MAG: cyanophycinase [Pseudomonadota bacterium]